jgi:hypothetical protein
MPRSSDHRNRTGSSPEAPTHHLPPSDPGESPGPTDGLKLPPLRRRLLAGGAWAFLGKTVNVAGNRTWAGRLNVTYRARSGFRADPDTAHA